MKPYQHTEIVECGEPLIAIPEDLFCLPQPHFYLSLGAPYGQAAPFLLRQSVLNCLIQARALLQEVQPGWQMLIFDAYRPVAVQQFMVEYTFAEILQAEGHQREALNPQQQADIWQRVFQIWAVPSDDPRTPPPHSTGAAIDITLVDASGQEIFMGSAIDELSPRSHPDYFAVLAQDATLDQETRRQAERADHHRQLLNRIMTEAGFTRHPGEWWHFSHGDQMWAWLQQQRHQQDAIARYGRVDRMTASTFTG